MTPEFITDQNDPRLSDLWQPDDPAVHSDLLHISLCAALSDLRCLREENKDLKQHNKNLEEYMLKGVAFRDELQSALRRIAAELGVDADGETMVEKVRFMREENETLTNEREAWIDTAAQHSRNEDYYRGLVVRIGEEIGPAAFAADDGSVMDDVLCAKVPELVDALTKDRDEARGALCSTEDYIKHAIGSLSVREHAELDGVIPLLRKALSSTAPCPHEEEAKRLKKLEYYATYQHSGGCGYVFDHQTQTGERVDECTCGLDIELRRRASGG